MHAVLAIVPEDYHISAKVDQQTIKSNIVRCTFLEDEKKKAKNQTPKARFITKLSRAKEALKGTAKKKALGARLLTATQTKCED